MTTSDSAAPVSAADNTPTYYVVPVKSGSERTLAVWYYQQPDSASNWVKVAATTLDASSQGGNTDQVRLVQPSQQEIIDNTNLIPADLDTTVTLYAAVARTLSALETLPRNYAAGINPTVTIDVAPGTIRGLTLVFTRHANGDVNAADVTQLMSTNEPEIKNGVGTDPEPRVQAG